MDLNLSVTDHEGISHLLSYLHSKGSSRRVGNSNIHLCHTARVAMMVHALSSPLYGIATAKAFLAANVMQHTVHPMFSTPAIVHHSRPINVWIHPRHT